MLKRAMTTAMAAAMASGALAASATAASGPPAPTAANGHKVQVVATGLTTPTSFAFGGGTVFEGDGGNLPTSPGGVYVLKGGKATLLPKSPFFVAGLVWHKGTLYISGGNMTAKGPSFSIWAWSGWNGTKFAKQKAIYTASKKFSGFDGLTIGPDGRIYVGVGLSQTNDHSPPTTPYEYDLLSLDTHGKHLKVFASGIRQPWQIAFAPGSSSPFVTDLGQDAPKTLKNPPDFLLHVKKGDNFGFPQCNWTKVKACKGFAKPFKLFPSHTDVGGIAIVRKTIFLTEFGMGGHPAQVVTVPVTGGKAKPFLTGFGPVPIIGIGTHGGYVYVGALSGIVYRVKG